MSDVQIAEVARTISPTNIRQLASEYLNLSTYEIERITPQEISIVYKNIVHTIHQWIKEHAVQTNTFEKFKRMLHSAYEDGVINQDTSQVIDGSSGKILADDIIHIIDICVCVLVCVCVVCV